MNPTITKQPFTVWAHNGRYQKFIHRARGKIYMAVMESIYPMHTTRYARRVCRTASEAQSYGERRAPMNNQVEVVGLFAALVLAVVFFVALTWYGRRTRSLSRRLQTAMALTFVAIPLIGLLALLMRVLWR